MMAHSGSASRHGRYDAFRTDFSADNPADELPSQSVFSYDGAEAVKKPRENPTIGRPRPGPMAQGVIPPGPVVAVHMFDVPSDQSDSRESSPSQLRRWSREALDASSGIPPASPRPPSTPRLSRPGSMRRRSRSGQRPPSSQGQRPPSGQGQRPASSQRSSFCLESEDPLPPMTTLRPQSSLGRYHVLPSISPTGQHSHGSDAAAMATYRSDGSDEQHQRGKEEAEYLTSKLARQSLVEHARKGESWEGGGGGGGRESHHHHHGELTPKMALGSGFSGEDLTHRSGGSSSANTLARKDSLPSHSTPVEEGHTTGRRTRSGSPTSSSSSSSPPRSHSGADSVSPELAPNERSHTSIAQYRMDEEATPPVEDGQVLLGVKIPTDGTRHKQCFNCRDQLRCIVLFAEEVSGHDFSNHVLVLVSPRRVFANLSQTIQSAGLESKSVVHLEELDD